MRQRSSKPPSPSKAVHQRQTVSIPQAVNASASTDRSKSLVGNILPLTPLVPRFYEDATSSGSLNSNELRILAAGTKKNMSRPTVGRKRGAEGVGGRYAASAALLGTWLGTRENEYD